MDAEQLILIGFILFALCVAMLGHVIAKRARPEFWQEPREEPVSLSLGDLL